MLLLCLILSREQKINDKIQVHNWFIGHCLWYDCMRTKTLYDFFVLCKYVYSDVILCINQWIISIWFFSLWVVMVINFVIGKMLKHRTLVLFLFVKLQNLCKSSDFVTRFLLKLMSCFNWILCSWCDRFAEQKTTFLYANDNRNMHVLCTKAKLEEKIENVIVLPHLIDFNFMTCHMSNALHIYKCVGEMEKTVSISILLIRSYRNAF